MPFNGNQYVPPAGAESAAPGNVLQSAIWNSIFTDIAAALTQLATQANTTPTWANILAPNGGFSIWQRNPAGLTVTPSSTVYTADRWYLTTGANQSTTVNPANGLTTAAPPAHAAKITRLSGQAGTTAMIFGYPLTADEVYRIRNLNVSFSCAAAAGANWSPTNGTFTINLFVGTGTAQKAGAAGVNFTNVTNPLSISVNLAAGAVNRTISGTSSAIVPSTSTQGEIQVTWTPVGTAGVDDSITFDQFNLVAGTIVEGFEDLPFDVSLRECKRFYRKSFPYSVAPAQAAGFPGALVLVAQAAAALGFYVQFEPVEMVATASFTTYHPQAASSNWANTSGASVAASFDSGSVSPKGFNINTATVSATGNTLYIHYSADAGL